MRLLLIRLLLIRLLLIRLLLIRLLLIRVQSCLALLARSGEHQPSMDGNPITQVYTLLSAGARQFVQSRVAANYRIPVSVAWLIRPERG